MTPILITVYAFAALAIFGAFAGIPLWLTRRHPDTAPATALPGYLRADWNQLPVRSLAGAGQRSGQ